MFIPTLLHLYDFDSDNHEQCLAFQNNPVISCLEKRSFRCGHSNGTFKRLKEILFCFTRLINLNVVVQLRCISRKNKSNDFVKTYKDKSTNVERYSHFLCK